MTRIDWAGLLWETRGWLGVGDDAPVPRDELVETAKANGWGDREVRRALRETDQLEAADDNLEYVREAKDVETPETPKGDESDPERADISTETPTPDTVEPAEDDAVEHVPDDLPQNGEGLDDAIAERSGEWFHPPTIQARDWWVTWILDGVGRKRPVAPWQNGHAYPAEWSEGLDDDERPETGYATARRWVDFSLDELGLALPEDAQSEELELGIILPADRPEDLKDRITLIDWDDVRDPDTGEIHPVAAEYIDRVGGYVEISTSDEGLHQFVTGGLRHRGKFIAPIDDEPFIGDDLPQVEIYDGGRHVAMTGRHVAGTDVDVAEGQDGIDAIITEYADAETDAGHRRYDPETGDDTGGEDGEGSTVPKPETGEYAGPPLEELAATRPDDRPLDYHVVVETFYRGGGNAGGYANVQNWRLEGFAAALGERDDLGAEAVKEDLGGRYLDDTDVECGCVHRTPERIEYGYKRARTGRLEAPSYSTLDEYGILPPAVTDDEDGEEYDDDPRRLEATVDVKRAWDAAGRVEPAALDEPLPYDMTDDSEAWLVDGERVDVVRAVAIDSGFVDTRDEPLDEDYSKAYRRAREDYGAPLPEYYTAADAIAEFDAVLDVIGEVTFFHLDTEALETEITEEGDEVGGDAVRALNPAWRDSESEASLLVFESGTVWDADTERVLDALRFVALDSGLIDEPGDPLEGERFTEAYRRCRRVYGAPLPRWEPAADGAREITPQLPPSEELVDARDLDGVDPDALEVTREDVEALIRDATAGADDPTVIRALPATGKTTGTVKTAGERPLSYLAPRKELQQQALEKADRWGVDAEICPVLSENRVREDVLAGAMSHVREQGKSRLRDRWTILSAAFDNLEEDDDAPELGDIFTDDEDDDEVDLDRPTCETAEGEHGVAWALTVHVARRLEYTPQEIHTQAAGLFGAPLPCTCDGEESKTCEYGDGWDAVGDADSPPDLLVGSYVHAHVPSVRTAYSRAADGTIDTSPRAVVLDEFPGEAFVREFDEKALDFASWLARCLRDDVDDRRDMYDADLYGDEWVRAWLGGTVSDTDLLDDTLGALARTGDLYDAREGADAILGEVEDDTLAELGLRDPLADLVDGTDDAAAVFRDLRAAVGAVDPNHPRRGVVRWAEEDVAEPLGRATVEGSSTPTVDAIDTDEAPFSGDLEAIVSRAVEAVREGNDDAPPALDAATTALRGGREGCRRLAAWADDGYSHPDAHHLLRGVITPTDEDADDPGARRIDTDTWAFDPDATDGTTLDVVASEDRGRIVVDRNDHGALLHTPPSRKAGNGDKVALVGLDATGRRELWANALGEDVTVADIHDTPAERARFLEEALDLRVLQAADRPRYYEGDPTTKDTDGDVALLEAIAEEYSGIDAPRQRGEEPIPVGKPAAITTKGVREVLENDSRLDDVVAEWENYGNLTGTNDLGKHRLAAVLGCQHYGDHAIERFAALAGEEVDVGRGGGRGVDLEYGSDVANAYLQHMTEDQTMQAILRFARGDSGATVVARTGALREDLPVVGRAQVVETWSETARAIAKRYRRLGAEFTVADVADAVDVTKHQVRVVLRELADAGYIRCVEAGDGVASVYEADSTPGAGEVDLPRRDGAVDATGSPGRSPHNQYYTWNVRVSGVKERHEEPRSGTAAPNSRAPPSPTAVDGVDPPS